ncbi:hypothetical protein ACEWY4_021490 [Coilia grayii]|uniref:CCHC-type domain-containing protein n=1 Tax=Coilia grayii TaxID=363190 RepID=A0ABD1J985_9TELE
MAGRGRGSRRAAVEAGEDEQVGTVDGREDPEVNNGSHEPTLSDLVSILQAHMAQQKEQEVLRSREADQQWQTIKELQVQFSHLHQTVQDQSTSSPVYSGGYCQQSDPFEEEEEEEDDQAYGLHPYGGHDSSGRSSHAFYPKLQKLTDEDDIEHFLITFERIARACRWPRADWSFHLIPLLTDKARGAYVHMDISWDVCYSKVKAAILAKYDVNAESYRLKFRGLDVHPGESLKELYVRLKELYHKWILPEDKSIEEVGEMIILEQYLHMVSPELQIWLKEHDPKSASEDAMLASTYVSARRKDQPWSYKSWRNSRDARGPSHHAPPQRPPVHAGKPPNRFYGSGPSRRPPICFLCGQEGHTKPVCPKNAAKLTQVCCVPRKEPAVGGTNQSRQLVSVEVNGRGAEALLDTGSDQTLIQPQYVQPSQVSMSDTVSIRCVHGDEKPLPTADVYLKMRERLQKMSALAQEHMAQAQRGQKVWYDRSARQRNFAPGQQVLVMLPSHESKLLAKWQGPYVVQEEIWPTTYCVSVPGQRRSRVLHVNLLKEWVSRPGKEAGSMLIRRVVEEDEDEEQYLPKMVPSGLDLQHLLGKRQQEVRALCNPDVFSEIPGLSHVVSHDIVLKEGASVRRMSYRVPERLLGPLKEEVDQMLSLAIIEPSKSECASWDQHLEHLRTVFTHLQEAGLTINPGKCSFAKAEIEYLGFVIELPC